MTHRTTFTLGQFAAVITSALRAFAGIVPSSYPVTVPYKGSTTIKELVVAGRYSYANTNITDANFPQEQEGAEKVSVELVHFNRAVSTHDVLTELDARGRRAANVAELLAFAAKYPEIQHKFLIAALGQEWQYHTSNPFWVYLDSLNGGRKVSIGLVKDYWPRHSRFAAVRK